MVALCHLQSAIQECSSTLFAWSPPRYNVIQKIQCSYQQKCLRGFFFYIFYLYFSNSTTRHKTVCRQAKKRWVGGKAVNTWPILMARKKKTGSHDWMWYLIFWLEPSPPFGVWELHFLPLLQAQPARETSSEYPLKIKPTIFKIPVSCSNHWMTSAPFTSLL